jgi:dihydrofolate reductase
MYISGNLNNEIKHIEYLNEGVITWVIGGPKIIEQTLDIIDEFYLSRIPGAYACDTFLPLKKIENLFEMTWNEDHGDVEFQIWSKL